MKNRQAIYILFAANSISGLAQGITMIAIPWHFTNVLNMPSGFGIITMVATFLSLLWGLYAGVMIDRYNRKHVFLAITTGGFIIMLLVSLLGFYLGQLPMLSVAFIYCSMFLIFTVHYPNLFAFAQEITDPKDYGRIISWIEIQGQATTAASMALGAVLYGGARSGEISLLGFQVKLATVLRPWELHEIFLLNAITFLLAGLLISFIRFQPLAHRSAEISGVLSRLKAGFDYLNKHRLIFIFGTASFFIFVTILITGFYLNPIYIKNHLQQEAGVYASYEMYFAVGSLLAGIGIRTLFRKSNTVAAIIIMSLGISALYFICMWNTHLGVFYLIGLMQGFGNAGTRIMRMTYLFHHIPNQVIGRTGGVFMTVSVILRLILIFVISRPFFVSGNQVIYSYFILALFVLSAATLMSMFYTRLVALPAHSDIRLADKGKNYNQISKH